MGSNEVTRVSECSKTGNESLEDATCLVTGGSRGIGKTIVQSLAEAGATVIVNHRDSESAASSLVEEVAGRGTAAEAIRADVSDFDAVQTMAAEVRSEYGSIDVLVNNAGITIDNRFERMDHDDWTHVIDVNLTGAFNCTKAFFQSLQQADSGRIINISSIVAQRGNFGQCNYAASKSGLFGFSKSLALELAPHETTVNCVAPGFTQTDMLATLPDQIKADIQDRIPLQRFATAEEVACIVQFLASPESSYITGEIINVNGGMYG